MAKLITDYTFSELIQLTEEQFVEVLNADTSNLGILISVKKYFNLQYEVVTKVVEDLNKSYEESSDEGHKSDCKNLIEQSYGLLLNIEAKACIIQKKIDNIINSSVMTPNGI